MTPDRLLAHFDRIAEAPDAVPRLRRFILELAVRGELVEQDPNDEPAAELLKRIQAEKERLVKTGEIKNGKPLQVIGEDERPFVVPKKWQWIRLGNITAYIQRGKSPKYAAFDGLPVVSQKCVQWSGLKLDFAKLITRDSIEDYEDVRFLRDGDLLWNSTGTGTIGRIIKLTEPPAKLVCDSHVTVVRCFHVNAEYIRLWLRSDHVYGSIEERAAGSTNQVELTSQMAINQVVPLPSLAEQHRIVAKVDELMALCDRLEAAQAERENRRDRLVAASLHRLNNGADAADFREHARFHLDHLARFTTRPEQITGLRQTILNLAVGGKLVQQAADDIPVSQVLVRIQIEKARQVASGHSKFEAALDPIKPEELPFVLPDGWAWCKIDSLISSLRSDIRTGPFGSSLHKADHRPKGVPVWGIESINKKGAFTGINKIFVDSEKALELSPFAVKGGDIIISRSGTVGDLCRLPDNVPYGLISTNLMKISLDRRVVSPDYFYFLFKGTRSIDMQLMEL